MKIFKKILMMTLVAATVAMVGCTKEQAEEINQIIEDATPGSLAGTTWVSDGPEEYNGVTAQVHSSIHFETATTGYIDLTSIVDGETISGGSNITYTYTKPNGVLTLIIEGVSAGDMNFTVATNKLYLKIQNGTATRVYTLVEDNPQQDDGLVCSEWEYVYRNDYGTTETTVFCFLDNQRLAMVTSYVTEDPKDDMTTYLSVNYTFSGNRGSYTESGTTYSFTINGNKMNVTGNDGFALELTRRSAKPPQSLVNTAWRETVYDEYHNEADDSYYDDVTISTLYFSANGQGTAENEYTVPELPQVHEFFSMNISYTYKRPFGTVTLGIDDDLKTFNMIALSDVMILYDDDDFYTLKKVSK